MKMAVSYMDPKDTTHLYSAADLKWAHFKSAAK